MKNALKVIIFIVAVLALCAGGIFGYTKYMKTDFDFSDGTKSGTVEITAYNGDSVNIIIPKKIRGKTVVQIAQSAFAKTDITSVEIPDTVTSVGEKAFANCEKLERVKIGNSVKSIGNSCFYKYPRFCRKIGRRSVSLLFCAYFARNRRRSKLCYERRNFI